MNVASSINYTYYIVETICLVIHRTAFLGSHVDSVMYIIFNVVDWVVFVDKIYDFIFSVKFYALDPNSLHEDITRSQTYLFISHTPITHVSVDIKSACK